VYFKKQINHQKSNKNR